MFDVGCDGEAFCVYGDAVSGLILCCVECCGGGWVLGAGGRRVGGWSLEGVVLEC